MKRHIISALMVLILVTGCTYIPDNAEGKLMVSLPSDGMRGVENVVFETDHYMISVVNTDKEITYDAFRVERSGMERPEMVASGNTTVRVDAYNRAGIKIGTGSASLFVRPMKLNEVRVTVDEIGGTSELTVEVMSEAQGMTLTAKLFRAGETEPAYSFILDPTEGGYSGTENVGHGIWKVFVDNGEEDLFLDTVRIAAGHPITVRGTIGDDWKISVEIIDSILPTPEVSISGGKASYEPGEAYFLTATVTGVEEPRISWFLDGREIQGENGATINGTLPTDGTCRAGEHTFTVLIEKEAVAWTGDISFTVSEVSE